MFVSVGWELQQGYFSGPEMLMSFQLGAVRTVLRFIVQVHPENKQTTKKTDRQTTRQQGRHKTGASSLEPLLNGSRRAFFWWVLL